MKKLIALLCFAALSGAGADTFKVDPVHSTVLVRVKHLDLSNAYGRFNDISGTIEVDPTDVEKGKLDFTVKTDSIDTANDKRDAHLKSPDFFDTKQFPVITFKSSSIKKIDEKNYELTGDLTIKGVTKPVTGKFEHFGVGKGMQGEERIAAEALFKIKRTDFGMNFLVGPVGNDAEIIVSIEAAK